MIILTIDEINRFFDLEGEILQEAVEKTRNLSSEIVATLSSRISDLETQNQSHKARYDDLQQRYVNRQITIEHLRTQINQGDEIIKVQEIQMKELNNKVADQEGYIISVEKKLKEMESKHASEVAALEENLKETTRGLGDIREAFRTFSKEMEGI
jgi:chromosome segregation ATPase